MCARLWFESIRASVLDIRKLEQKIEEAETKAGPHGQLSGSIGGGSHDSLRGIDRLVDSGLRERLERMREVTNPEIERALEVLYGRSGRGGLARARGATDADILCCYYLQGMDWARIADDLARPDVVRPNGWCRLRAMRALAYVDRVGCGWLARS